VSHVTHTPGPPSRWDLIAFLASLTTGVVLILGAHVPAQDVAMTATSVIGAFSLWRSSRGGSRD